MNKLLISFFILFSFPGVLFAAEFGLESSTSEVRLGERFNVEVVLGSPDEPVNAFEGSINFLPNLELKEIRYSKSIVPLWVAKPEEKESGSLAFAGVIPGGLQGSGNIFTLVFEALSEGGGNISFGPETRVYKNDGAGGLADLAADKLSFSVMPALSGTKQEAPLQDTTPPESFAPVVTSGEPFGYRGKVLVFNTQDKDSGVESYVVGYSNFPNRSSENISWQKAESPFFLPDGNRKIFLYVKAADTAGNERIEVLTLSGYALLFACLIPLAGIIILFLCLKRFYIRSS